MGDPPKQRADAGGMEILASQIKRELETRTANVGHCAIYEEQLQRIWPVNQEDRERQIVQFARLHGFHLSFYKKGLCAIFVKESPNLPLSGNQKRF